MHNSLDSSDTFDVRDIPCRDKHALIFQRWNELPLNGAFILVNHHDPHPLRHQFQTLYGQAFGWEYLERSADLVRIKISRLAETDAVDVTTVPGCGHHGH